MRSDELHTRKVLFRRFENTYQKRFDKYGLPDPGGDGGISMFFEVEFGQGSTGIHLRVAPGMVLDCYGLVTKKDSGAEKRFSEYFDVGIDCGMGRPDAPLNYMSRRALAPKGTIQSNTVLGSAPCLECMSSFG